ncbi:hypothetical protein QLX08_000609 [Tetragonisca angustula]|uniref:Uncharacterized protein n=1 Tax=Tetragonisca angustula TaxID=166442 RepID=A0AAW1AIK7_9HYME
MEKLYHPAIFTFYTCSALANRKCAVALICRCACNPLFQTVAELRINWQQRVQARVKDFAHVESLCRSREWRKDEENGTEESEMRDACPNGGHLERPEAAIVSVYAFVAHTGPYTSRKTYDTTAFRSQRAI